MKIVFAGTPEFAAEALAALINTDHEIIAVYTQPDRKAGRGQKLTASAVKQLALEHNLPVYQPLHFKASTEEGLAAQKQLAELNADVMVVAAYGLILPQAVLDMPKYGCLNIHGSLLPRWRGAAPIQRAIAAGDAETGVTIMKMAAGLDTGDMMYKTICPIEATDTSASLHRRWQILTAWQTNKNSRRRRSTGPRPKGRKPLGCQPTEGRQLSPVSKGRIDKAIIAASGVNNGA